MHDKTTHHEPARITEAESALSRYREDCRAATAELRASCLAELRRLGVERLEAEYSGYADEGNVDDVRLEPVPADMPDGLIARLHELVWQTAYQVNNGFENNEGGSGELCWSVNDDSITIEHSTYYTAAEHSRHENI